MPRWDADRIAQVRDLLIEALQSGIYARTEAYQYVSDQLDDHPTYDALRKVIFRNGLWDEAREAVVRTPPKNAVHTPPAFPDLKRGEVPWREWIARTVEMQDLHVRAGRAQSTCTVDLSGVDHPIAVMFTSDWHLGSLGTDYRSWMEDVEYVLDTPHLYMGVVGDAKDNFRSFKSLQAVLSQLFPPHVQDDVVSQVTQELADAGKILFHSWGNHDYEWDINQTGYSELVAKIVDAGVPYLSGQGLVNLLVGRERYTTLVVHRTRFNSYLHTLHGAKRTYETIYPARIVATAHTHNPDYETFTRYELAETLGEEFGGTTYLIKCGTYKTNDGYSLRNFGAPRCSTVTCVLYPDRQKVVPFANAEDAVQFMNSL